MHIIIGKRTEIIATGVAVSDIENLNNSKIGFGIKRADNHEQPDIGKKNITILDKYEALYMGNNKVIHASNPSTGITTSLANYRTIAKIRRVIY